MDIGTLSLTLAPNKNQGTLDHLYKTVCKTHFESFNKLREAIKGKNVVLFGGGNSVSIFNHIDNAIYIGLNAMVFSPMHLDYVCFQDNHRGIIARAQERQDDIQIICGENVFCHFNKINIEDAFTKVLKFFTAYISTVTFPKWSVDILEKPVDFFSSTAFALLQIILWCEPRNIYLAGFDCNGAGGYLVHSAMRNYAQILPVWRAFKRFASANYPAVGISVVNPLGLKGLFSEIYQDRDGLEAIGMLEEQDRSKVHSYISNPAKLKNPGIIPLILKYWRDSGCHRGALANASEMHRKTGYQGFLKFIALTESSSDDNRALDLARETLDLYPDIFFTHAYFIMNEWLENKETYWMRLLRRPDAKFLRPYLGMAMWYGFFYYRDAGMQAKAIACGRKNLELSPDGNAIKKDLFLYFMEREDYRAAHDLVKECSILNPSWAECDYMKGMLAKVDERKSDAIRLLSRAIEKAPELFIYRIRLAELFRHYGDITAAHSIINEGLGISPTWHDGYYQRAQNYLAAGSTIAAAENIQMAINLLPVELSPFRPYREALAYLLLACGAVSKARDLLYETLEIIPEWGKGWHLLSEIYEKHSNK